MKRSPGFTLVEVILVVITLALIGFVGYNTFTHLSKTDKTDSAQVISAPQTPVAPEIKVTSDLDKASAALDQIDPDSNASELANLEKDLATF